MDERRPVAFAPVVHFHQPVGNLDSVVRRATDLCYRPFVDALAAHPAIKVSLHYSGCLLEWLEDHEPALLDDLAVLVGRGQVELMTGGFYEPVLAALPERDRVGQIIKLTTYLTERFGAQPRGAWLTERVWEQDVTAALIDAGVTYTVVDDTMFFAVGVPDDALTGPFVTDDGHRPLLVFAGDRRLRYTIPYNPVADVLGHLADPRRLYVYADDGEKFGEWPGTHERVIVNGWLERFFAALSSSQHVRTVHLAEAATKPPAGRVYLGSSSYDEMMRWALPAAARLRLAAIRHRLELDDPDGELDFLTGAPWRAFLAKYPEVNRLAKRMWHVSAQVDAAGDDEARRDLYRAQCNCAYWHGAFGGVYLGFMRSALWHHLMRAEAIAQAADPSPAIEVLDVDADTRPEILLRAPWGAVVIAPQLGGRLVELGDHTVGANLLAALGIRPEAYHLGVESYAASTRGDDEMAPLQAHAKIEPSALSFAEDEPAGLIDLVDGERVAVPYDASIDGTVVRLRGEHAGVKIAKQLSAGAEELIAAYDLERAGPPERLRFAVAFTVLPLSLGREVAPSIVEATPSSVTVRQPFGELGLAISTSEPAAVTHEEIKSASASLEGLKELYQGTLVTLAYEPVIGDGAPFRFELRLRPLPGKQNKADKGVSA